MLHCAWFTCLVFDCFVLCVFVVVVHDLVRMCCDGLMLACFCLAFFVILLCHVYVYSGSFVIAVVVCYISLLYIIVVCALFV